MSYNPTSWQDHGVEYADRFGMESEGGYVIATPAPGEVYQEGTVITAERMNNIEIGIVNAHESLEQLDEGKVDISKIVNNLTTIEPGYVLDARQGKALADSVDTKLNTSNVVNNLTTTGEGYALDARQGNDLNEKIMVVSDAIGGRTLQPTQLFKGTLNAGGKVTLPDHHKYCLFLIVVDVNGSVPANILCARHETVVPTLRGTGLNGPATGRYFDSVEITFAEDMLTYSTKSFVDIISGTGTMTSAGRQINGIYGIL